MSVKKGGIKKILVANRGEIAIRVIRAARELGKKVVTVYTPQDVGGPWRYMSDESYEISNYLDIDQILDVAKKSKSDAIHPGYGFLSEREDFAKACEEKGIKFIGPSPESLLMSGDKAIARQKAKEAGIPTVPGSDVISSPEEGLNTARKIGFPVLLKAAGGGGGKGMRPCFSEDEFVHLFKQASEEAKAAFGDPRVYLEKYIQNPKHIEVQVIADEHGKYLHLFERDCSLQRRNQKVIEESPSPHLPENVRQKMCKAAVDVMKKINYFNAGTVEFIVDRDWNFYFIEINARVQVEHPVTELVTGVDIVKRQIKIAQGEKLDLDQEQVKVHGHAMELRIYAEDPFNDFMPSGGLVNFYREPSLPGVRCDGWLYSGISVPSQYDPLLLKLLAKGENRQEVITKLLVALEELKIDGIKNNIPFFKFVLKYKDFVEGNIDTWSMKKILEDFKNQVVESLPEPLLLLGAYLSSFSSPQQFSNGYTDSKVQKVWRKSSWKFSGRLDVRLK
ncbi:MAG: ATP-grasp domain-containing protein [Candidatus Calescibacterium sp.]|nr:ATP-grasp domain-containing protein [Candidatus Calescibacterium sp.]MCX7734368.1 ATP-grasp domain-containing protein [bacterium]MDW8086868.1 biotin carboxylase N-terminal domain-containing protein [Candidatus Calescibacterium sp.]